MSMWLRRLRRDSVGALESASQATRLNRMSRVLNMPLWFQHLLVMLLVSACVAYAIWGAVRTLVGKRSHLGSCCARGCGAGQTDAKRSDKLQAAQTQRVVFLPAELLGHSGRRK